MKTIVEVKKPPVSKKGAKPVSPKPGMKVDEAAQKLLAMGKKKGFVTYEQINQLLPPDSTPAEKIEEVVTLLNEKNIEITSAKAGKADSAFP